MNALDLILPAGVSQADAVAAIAAAGALVVLMLVWRALLDHDPLPARLKALEARRTELRGALAARARRSRRMGASDGMWEMFKRRLRGARGAGTELAQLRLARAGFRSRDALVAYRLARMLAPVVLGLLATFWVYVLDVGKLGDMKPAAILAAILAGLYAPNLFLTNAMQKRQQAIARTLPDTFDLLVICAEAGLSLDASLDRVARETAQSAPELSDEISVAALELSFLPDRAKALSGLAERVPLPGVRALVNTFQQTERYGTPLAQALRVLAAELRDERMLKAEEKAARLPATLTVPMIIFILPPLFVVLIGPAILRTLDSVAGMR